jgi:hypothetical protein
VRLEIQCSRRSLSVVFTSRSTAASPKSCSSPSGPRQDDMASRGPQVVDKGDEYKQLAKESDLPLHLQSMPDGEDFLQRSQNVTDCVGESLAVKLNLIEHTAEDRIHLGKVAFQLHRHLMPHDAVVLDNAESEVLEFRHIRRVAIGGHPYCKNTAVCLHHEPSGGRSFDAEYPVDTFR